MARATRPSPPPPRVAGPATGDDVDGLYAREAPRLSRFFRRRSQSADEIADLVQEAFLRFVRAAPAGPIERPAAYLQRIARNLLFDRSKQRAHAAAFLSPVPLDEVEIAVRPDQTDALEASQMMDQYQDALEQLPPRTREVFLLHRVDGLTYKEIADRLGIGTRTVEWHITEALVRIRRLLDEA